MGMGLSLKGSHMPYIKSGKGAGNGYDSPNGIGHAAGCGLALLTLIWKLVSCGGFFAANWLLVRINLRVR